MPGYPNVLSGGVGTYSPWHHFISAVGPEATNTSFSVPSIVTSRWFNLTRQSTGALNAEIGWDVNLSAGTWSLTLLHYKQSNRGIYHVKIDGTEVGTIDGYATLARTGRDTITGITVATGGKHRVLLRMETKNASSSALIADFSAVELQRTA